MSLNNKNDIWDSFLREAVNLLIEHHSDISTSDGTIKTIHLYWLRYCVESHEQDLANTIKDIDYLTQHAAVSQLENVPHEEDIERRLDLANMMSGRFSSKLLSDEFDTALVSGIYEDLLTEMEDNRDLDPLLVARIHIGYAHACFQLRYKVKESRRETEDYLSKIAPIMFAHVKAGIEIFNRVDVEAPERLEAMINDLIDVSGEGMIFFNAAKVCSKCYGIGYSQYPHRRDSARVTILAV
jgi:hypothetical protein